MCFGAKRVCRARQCGGSKVRSRNCSWFSLFKNQRLLHMWRPPELLLQNPCRSQSLENPNFKVNLKNAIVPGHCHRCLNSKRAQ